MTAAAWRPRPSREAAWWLLPPGEPQGAAPGCSTDTCTHGAVVSNSLTHETNNNNTFISWMGKKTNDILMWLPKELVSSLEMFWFLSDVKTQTFVLLCYDHHRFLITGFIIDISHVVLYISTFKELNEKIHVPIVEVCCHTEQSKKNLLVRSIWLKTGTNPGEIAIVVDHSFDVMWPLG